MGVPTSNRRLYGVLPVHVAGEITVTDAAKRVGCSRRSLRRYRDESCSSATSSV